MTGEPGNVASGAPCGRATAATSEPATPENRAPGPRDAAGPSYAGEWALFCDYTTATGQPALPTTVDTLTGFFTALPARPATLGRRVRAIAAAHRRAGYLLSRPDHGPAAPAPPRPAQQRWTAAGPLLAACPTRGWPHGLHGRRDAFLIVATIGLDLSHRGARALRPDAVTLAGSGGEHPDDQVSVADQDVPTDPDPRACPACAVVRWLDTLGVLDGLGRGSARMDLTAAEAPTRDSAHQHHPRTPQRWHGAAILLPAIDQHGWHDDYRPLTTRTIRTRLALARDRAHRATPKVTAPDTLSRWHAGTERSPTPETTAPQAPQSLDEVLTLLDAVADDADALNARITALIEGHS